MEHGGDEEVVTVDLCHRQKRAGHHHRSRLPLYVVKDKQNQITVCPEGPVRDGPLSVVMEADGGGGVISRYRSGLLTVTRREIFCVLVSLL